MKRNSVSTPSTTTPAPGKSKSGTFSWWQIVNRNGHERAKAVENPSAGPPKSVWREYFESAVVTVIMALFGMTFIVQAVKVPTGSMQNTITIGDRTHKAINDSTAPALVVAMLR